MRTAHPTQTQKTAIAGRAVRTANLQQNNVGRNDELRALGLLNSRFKINPKRSAGNLGLKQIFFF